MDKYIKMNLMMQQALRDSDNDKQVTFKQENINKLFLPQFRVEYDCVITSSGNHELLPEEEFNKSIIEMYTNKTGYEASLTDTLINYYLENEEVIIQDVLPIAFTVIEVWAAQLKMLDSISKFCFFITCESEYNHVTVRFHKLRKAEPIWIDSDIDKYEEPVGYVII